MFSRPWQVEPTTGGPLVSTAWLPAWLDSQKPMKGAPNIHSSSNSPALKRAQMLLLFKIAR